jgi:hypothetical protein
MTYLECSDTAATLTTWVYCSMWQLYAARKSGRQGYINWPMRSGRSLRAYQDPAQFGKVPNMYDWYFIQPIWDGVPLFDCVPPADETWVWHETHPEMGQYYLYSAPLAEIKEWYRENLRFSTAVEARGQVLASKYKIDFANTIGVTWRGTDIYLDGRPRLPIDLYFPFIDKILREHPERRIACTAEEDGILDPLLARYPQAFRIDEFISSPNGCKDNPERFSPVSGYERGIQPALMVWLFSKCAHLVKNRASTSAVASWLSKGEIVCLAHEERLEYTKPPILHPDTKVQIWP